MKGQMHKPVLLHEAVNALHVQKDGWYIDATFGRGGHTGEILKLGGKVVAFDCDQAAIDFGQEKFAAEIKSKNLVLVRENFEKIQEVTQKFTSEDKIGQVQGVLFDFGVSSPQLDEGSRGFSFLHDAELDMRMDDRLGVKAKDLLAVLSEKQLAESFIKYGGETQGRQVAKAIVTERQRHPITTVADLLEVVERVKGPKRAHLHPATKIFQALRILVNSELESIEQALPQAEKLLTPGGRIVTISFHEGEDRIAKNLFRQWEQAGKGQHITKDVITPSELEVTENSRARSAKMRIYEKNRS